MHLTVQSTVQPMPVQTQALPPPIPAPDQATFGGFDSAQIATASNGSALASDHHERGHATLLAASVETFSPHESLTTPCVMCWPDAPSIRALDDIPEPVCTQPISGPRTVAAAGLNQGDTGTAVSQPIEDNIASIGTYVRGLNNPARCLIVRDLVRQNRASIVCLPPRNKTCCR